MNEKGFPLPRLLGGQKDFWPLILFAVHLGHSFLFAHLYPYHLYDTDLFAYFIYFRNWLAHNPALHTVSFFPLPKPLLVFVLGPLANVSWAFYVSACASALLGSLTYLVARHFFGRASGLLLSTFLLLDPLKSILTLESNADLYLSFLLFLAIYLSTVGRSLLSSACLFLSALVKPVTLPCALYYLLDTGEEKRKKWLCAMLPLLAIPLTLLIDHALLGSAAGLTRFSAEFTALRDTNPLIPGQVLYFVLWTQFVKTRFVLMAPWGFLGILLWLTSDSKRLTSPLLLIPLFFLSGYLILSVFSPYTPFFRFYWPLEIWFLAFITYGIVESARRISSGQDWVRKGATCLLLFFLLDDSLRYYFMYRNGFALPFERGMAFVTTSLQVLKREKKEEETVLTSLAFMPYVMWELKIQERTDLLIVAEEAAAKGQVPRPDWIVYVPQISANPRAQALTDHLIGGEKYEPRLRDGTSVLFHRKP